MAQVPGVDWIKKARWVEDADIFTSSGVSAGMDMALAVIAKLHGQAKAEEVAMWAEYEWHQDAGYDPFAAPMETGSAYGPSNGNNDEAVTRRRVVADRMVGVPGDEVIRSDESGFPVNRHFVDVAQDEPVIEAEPATRTRSPPSTSSPISAAPM